jgi:hypothetical protein
MNIMSLEELGHRIRPSHKSNAAELALCDAMQSLIATLLGRLSSRAPAVPALHFTSRLPTGDPGAIRC